MSAEPNLQMIADQVAITMQIARIAQLADSGTIDEYIACFTEDAVWELTHVGTLPMDAQKITGHDEIIAGVHERRATGVQGPGSNTRHDVSSITVEVAGDRAEAHSYLRYYTGIDEFPVTAALRKYNDIFVRGAAGWQLSRRVITLG